MSYLEEYIEFLHKHEETHCSKKLAKMYFEDIEPIVKGKSDEFYFDENSALAVIRFIQGDIPSIEEFNRWLKEVPPSYKTNYLKVDYLERTGHFLGFIRQSKGEWADLPLALALFQKAYIEALYGIKRKSNGNRRFTDSWMEIGRKNGKTSLQVPLALRALFEEPGAEVYAASATYGQARRLRDQAVEVIERSPALKSVLGYKVNPRCDIYYKQMSSHFYALSGNTKNQDGFNSSCNIIDEAHVLPDETYNILKQATANTRQPLTNIITTAGYVRGALFDNKYEYYRKVLDKIIKDDSCLILIYELDNPEEMWDESKRFKANPGLGEIKKFEYLRDQVNSARNDNEALHSTQTKDFNIIGVQKNTWLDAETIQKGAYGPYEETIIDDPIKREEFLKGFDNTDVIGGYDLSKIGDLTAFTTALFDKEKHCVIFKTMYWCTEAFLNSLEAKSSRVPWGTWISRGLVRVSSDPQKINYNEVADYLSEEFEKHGYYYEHIAYDAWSASYLVDEIANRGWGKDYIQVPIRQGFKTLSIPVQTLWVYLKEKKICYLNNPVTKWMLTNVEMVPDRNGNMLPQKVNSNRANKIDGPATFFNIFAILCDNLKVYLE